MRALAVLLALLAGAASAPAGAQVNTERMRRGLERDTVRLALDATAAFAAGNAAYLQAGLGGRLDVRRGPHLAFVVGEGRVARAEGDVFLDRQFAHARYNRRLSGLVVAEAFTQAERNRQQRLEARTLVGAGLRLELVDADRAGLALGVTPMLEHERLAEATGEAPSTVARLSSYLSGRLALGEAAALTAVVYAQPRADAPGDARVLAQGALEVGLTRWVRLRVRADLRHDTRPPLGVEATDVVVENALVVVLPG